MSTDQPGKTPAAKGIGDQEHLRVLGYEDSFHRSMSLWANFALGFTYLSPLVGVTVEPAGGSTQPTTKPILAVQTSS